MALNLSTTVMRRIAKEMKELHTAPLEGITILPNDQDMTEVVAIIQGPGNYSSFKNSLSFFS
jgi:ubiquitin-conjugating enzyme E2 S